MARKKWCGRLSAVVIAALFAVTGSSAHAANREVGGCIPIKTAAQLQAMKNNLAGSYCLVRDIDAGSIENFIPIGKAADRFIGRFDGNGYVIRNLTIANTNPTVLHVGLFGFVGDRAVVQDVGLINADVSSNVANGYVGALIGVLSRAPTIHRVFATGKVVCSAPSCTAGGLIGYSGTGNILDAWSSATVSSVYAAGGLAGNLDDDSTVRNSYATGDVTCNSPCVLAGGFAVAFNTGDVVRDSFATGKVQCSACGLGLGGFAGIVSASTTLTNVYATGAVVGGAGATVGGLIGNHGGTVVASFAAGPVQGAAGASVGGLIGEITGTPTVTDCYWDTSTTGQTTSAGGLGTGRTMGQVLPASFGAPPWAIATTKNNPFLISDGFSSNLATLVRANKIYTALPIKQSDKSQYLGNPKHTNVASLATVYTMVARAIGQTLGVPSLDNVRIDRFFWHDATRRTLFRGPVTARATIGPMRPIRANTPLNVANVIGRFNARTWVVLRGNYKTAAGRRATHYMLGTLYTKRGVAIGLVIANDPFTGEQVAIDPVTKRVVLPRGFPLTGFKVNGYATISNIH